MAPNPTPNAAAADERQARLNAERWARGEFVDQYASRSLRAAEAVLIDRHRNALQGRVLELGCGAGRLTGHLSEVSDEVHGIDLSPAMVAYCQRAYPSATFSVGDLRDLSRFQQGAYDAVLAPFNVLDVLGDGDRLRALADIRGLLAPHGLLIFSSHNRHHALRARTHAKLWLRLLVGSPRRPLQSVRNLPARVANRLRLRRMQRFEEGYAIVNDEAHDFSVLHYYIAPDAQKRQLDDAGFELLECVDLDGHDVRPGERAERCSELHYVARPR